MNTRIYLLSLALGCLAPQFCFSAEDENCAKREIISALKEKRKPPVKISWQYIRDLQRERFGSCFTLEKGNTYEISGKRKVGSDVQYQLHEETTDLYKWMSATDLKRGEGKRAEIADHFFKRNTNRILHCFVLKDDARNFIITDHRENEGVFQVEVKNTRSDVSQWLPLNRVDLSDAIKKKCPAAEASSEEGEGRT